MIDRCIRASRPRASRMRWRGALIGALVLLVLGGPATSDESFADDGDKGTPVTLFTAIAQAGDEESIPKKLQPYRTSLLIVAKRFKLEATKHERLVKDKVTKVQLPQKLGEARITDKGKSRTVEVIRDGKTLVTATVNQYPIIIVDPKLKVGGQQVVLILDKGHK